MTNNICDLPNVDIFDPIKCVEAWNRCATDQQIHVYLNSEIQKTQQCLKSLAEGQKLINSTLNTRSLDAVKRINECELAIARLDGVQTTLQENFRALSSSNNEFKLSTQETLDLYQRSIDALTSANTKLTAAQERTHADLTRLRNELDMDKINQALAGYDAILDEARRLIAASEREYTIKITQIDTALKSLESSTSNTLASQNAENKKLIDNFRISVQQEITEIKSGLNAYITNTDKTINDFKTQVELKVKELSGRIDSSVESINQISGGMDAKIETIKTDFTEKYATEKAERMDSDEQLKGNFNQLERNTKEEIREFKNSVGSNILDMQGNFNDRINNVEKVLSTSHDADMRTLTSKVDDNYKELFKKIEDEDKNINSSLSERITEVQTNLNTKIITLEGDINGKFSELAINSENKDDELKRSINLVDEASRARDDQLTFKLEEVKESINAVNIEAESLKAEIKGEINVHVKQLNDRIDTISTEFTALDSNVKEKLADLKKQSNKQWTTLNTVEQRYNEVIELMKTYRDETTKNKPVSYSVTELTEGTYKELGPNALVSIIGDYENEDGTIKKINSILIKFIDVLPMSFSSGYLKYNEKLEAYEFKNSYAVTTEDLNINFTIVEKDGKNRTLSLFGSYNNKIILANYYPYSN